jgi:hypothetical protein
VGDRDTMRVLQFPKRADDVAEIKRLRTVLFWLIGDAEAWHRSWSTPQPPTDNEVRNIVSAKAALGDWKPEGFE